MASSKLMASSTSQDSDLKSKLSASASTSATDFLKINNAGDDLVMDGFSRSKRGSGHERVGEAESSSESDPPRAVRKTVDDVWKEIIEGKKRRQQPKEEMMTLEDFLMKAEAAEEKEEMRGAVEVKEEGSSGGIYAYESNSGVIGAEGVIGSDVGGLGRGRGKRSVSLLEPLDKAAQQRQRRMIKNRESAARSRERKQAYQVELESMSMRLEEENEVLLKEKADRTKKRLKQLMENVIPVVERRRPPPLRKVRSLQW